MKKKLERQELNRIDPDMNVGLKDEEVEERKLKGYQNIVHKVNEKTIPGIIMHNTFTFFNLILFTIAITFLFFIIFLYASGNAAIVDKHFGFSKFLFLIPAIMNVITGTIQEIHGKKVLDGLKIVTEMKVNVVRNGSIKEVPASDLVIDDVFIIKTGDQAQADFKVLKGSLQVDESMLTGESDYIKKNAGDTVFAGSAIIVGSGVGQVMEVGDETYSAKLSAKVRSLGSHKSELMTDIQKIIKLLAILMGIVSMIIIITLVVKVSLFGDDPSIWDGMTMSLGETVTWARIMITAGSFCVGIIPSGLVLITSVTLALSIVSLSRQHTLIQELYSLENLSRVDIICLDKTGTLTDGTMKVVDVKGFAPLDDILLHIKNLMGATESKNQTSEAIFKTFGANEDVEYKELIPFTSERKCSGIVYKDGKEVIMGAPEYLLDKKDDRLEIVNEKAKEGKRVIAVMYDNNLLAFIIIEDQIRKSAKDTLKFFRDNGVSVKIISGDNPFTVSKISEACGVPDADKFISLEGVALEEIPALVERYTIFARVSPEQKEAIVAALQANKHKVAMTGDGVNDVLALRRADSSITFSKATDAAKSCSDVVLLDDDFSHLKAVVGEGRRVISNIQRTAILYLMKSFTVTFLAVIMIAFKKGQMWYSIENVYMLEASVIGTGGFLLSLEGTKNPIRGTFIKNINLKGLVSGLLGAISITLPIMMYTIPTYFGKAPLISIGNVSTMITILITISGLTVALTMCIPFNRFRTIAFILLLGTAFALAMMLPTSYIGGRPTSAAMFKGDTISDWQIVKEFLRPWNSQVIKDLFSDTDNFIIMGIFFAVVMPSYFLITKLINKKLEHDYLKDEYATSNNIFEKYF